MTTFDAPLPPAEPDLPDDLLAEGIPAVLVDGELDEVSVPGDDLSSRDARGLTMRDAVLTDVALGDSVLTRATLRDVIVRDADAANIQLDEAEIHRVRFERSRLTGAIFAGGRLADVTFADCRLICATCGSRASGVCASRDASCGRPTSKASGATRSSSVIAT